MKCNELIQYLSDYIDQKLDTELSEEVRQHLATCDNCCIALDTTQKTILLYKTAGHEELPIGQRSRLFERLQDELIKRGDCPQGILLPERMRSAKKQDM